MPGFDERVLRYQCCIALDAMRFFAESDDEDAYRFARDRIRSLLDVTA